MNRRLILIVLAVIAGLAALAWALGLFGNHKDQGLQLYGNVDVREVDMAFRVPGRIAMVAVDEGQHVKQGQILAELDTASTKARLNQADASVAQARAQLAKLENGSRQQDIAQGRARVAQADIALHEAEQDVSRRQGLVGPGAISQDQWQQTLAMRDRARAQLQEAQAGLSLLLAGARPEDVAAARAQLAAAQANRESAATDIGDTRLVADSDGTVLTRAREPGAIVQPGETVLTISIDRPMRVRAYVGEPDLSRVRPGMQVTVTADGNARVYHGTIGSIASKAEFTPKSVETADLRTDLVYRTMILVSDPDGGLRQGQPVTVDVVGVHPAKD